MENQSGETLISARPVLAERETTPTLHYRSSLPYRRGLSAGDVAAAVMGIGITIVMLAVALPAFVGACILAAKGDVPFVLIFLFLFVVFLAAAMSALGTAVTIMAGQHLASQEYHGGVKLRHMSAATFTGIVGAGLLIVVLLLIPGLLHESNGGLELVAAIFFLIMSLLVATALLRYSWIHFGFETVRKRPGG